MKIYEKYNQLDIDSRLIGLEKGDYGEYFCTPVNATVIGWDAEQFGEFVQSDDNKYVPGQAEVMIRWEWRDRMEQKVKGR